MGFSAISFLVTSCGVQVSNGRSDQSKCSSANILVDSPFLVESCHCFECMTIVITECIFSPGVYRVILVIVSPVVDVIRITKSFYNVQRIKVLIFKYLYVTSYILIIATFVTMTDYIIAAISVDLHKALGAFISLIVVNCLILSRAEAFASKNTIGRSILDALGMGIGFTFALFCLGAIREIFGNGSIFGLALFPGTFQEWVVMILPAGGFFTLALWLLIFNIAKERRANS